MDLRLLIFILSLLLSTATHAADSRPAAVVVAKAYAPGRISVVSPDYRAAVKGTTTITVRAPGLATIAPSCWKQGSGFGSESPLAAQPIALDADGNASFRFPADEFPHGPMAIRIVGAKADAKPGEVPADICYLELYNEGGVGWSAGAKAFAQPPQAAGMIRTYLDDFDAMPSISRSGAGATYCSRKPDDSEFGMAIFADREGPHNPFFQTETYLRIRMTHRPEITGDGWNRRHTTGFLSSLRVDGTGFKTAPKTEQYFECRLTWGHASGMWPAFWLLSANNYKGNPGPCDEMDILEAYMPWSYGYRIAHHEWGRPKDGPPEVHGGPKDPIRCETLAGKGDVCETWHTYGCLITERKTSYWFDDVEVFSHPTHPYTWSQGNYFMINLALQGDFKTEAGGFDRYGGAGDLWVDWVRVWEKKPAEAPKP